MPSSGPAELVLGDLDAVDHQHAGVAVAEVDGDVVDGPGERAVLRADRLDVGRRGSTVPPGVVSALASRIAPRFSTTSSATATIATRPGCRNNRA